MGVKFFRNQFEQMTPDVHVEWRPYDFRVEVFEEYEEPYSFLTKLPSICSLEREYWFAQVRVIFLFSSLQFHNRTVI